VDVEFYGADGVCVLTCPPSTQGVYLSVLRAKFSLSLSFSLSPSLPPSLPPPLSLSLSLSPPLPLSGSEALSEGMLARIHELTYWRTHAQGQGGTRTGHLVRMACQELPWGDAASISRCRCLDAIPPKPSSPFPASPEQASLARSLSGTLPLFPRVRPRLAPHASPSPSAPPCWPPHSTPRTCTPRTQTICQTLPP
jgi:hypothetical protein